MKYKITGFFLIVFMISPSVWSLDLQQSVLTALGRVEESKIVASQIRQGQNRIDEADAAYYK